MHDAEPEPSAQPSVDVEEDDWDAVNAEGTPEADGTQDVGPEESFDTEDEDDEVVRATMLLLPTCRSLYATSDDLIRLGMHISLLYQLRQLYDHRQHSPPQQPKRSLARRESV